MRINTPNTYNVTTHEGGKAFAHLKPLQALRRSVLSCLLWEDTFYESGKSIVERIGELQSQVTTHELAALAIEARQVHHLRHVSLLLLTHLAKREGRIVGDTIATVIMRADELAEFLALYWKDGKKPLTRQIKRGLAEAFTKFDEYQLAKYNRDNAIKLRDVMFLVHPKPKDDAQAALWKRLADKTLTSPDTWEVSLSAGKNKCETFTRLLKENKLGYLALLRNLRNMVESGVDMDLIRGALAEGNSYRVLPFRFVAAARACPRLEPEIDRALINKIRGMKPFSGLTCVLVDVSGSMYYSKVSARSDITRKVAAATLASIIPGDRRVFVFDTSIKELPTRTGMAGVDAICSQGGGGTALGAAVDFINKNVVCERLIVITDEQTADRVPNPVAKAAYMINVASYQNGVGYGPWVHIDGFSENVLTFISEYEQEHYND